ncbi:ABC transporter substrate-binding protein [Comamonas sp. GB3 AK4-5]|uniref:ABC transporter substrate-binding protein n=1 Tax=Comamonas sp. GB3 AK4-5 TaxID=3231487 RepID=UPI00351E25D2
MDAALNPCLRTLRQATAALLCAVAGWAVADPAPLPAPIPAPQRIVSLLPSLTEAVCALGACGRLVGVDVFSEDPPAVRHLPQLGRTWEPDIERIIQLRPDVVFMGRVPPAQRRLEAAGLRVVVADASTLPEVRAMLLQVDSVLQQQRGEALWQLLQQRMMQVVQRSQQDRQGRPAPRVYLEVDAALFAAAPGSFMGQLLALLEVQNIVPVSDRPFPRLAPEFVLKADPDLIIQTHGATARELAQRPGWAKLRAVRTGQVCRLSQAESRAVTRPGPRLDVAAAVLARCLQMPQTAAVMPAAWKDPI